MRYYIIIAFNQINKHVINDQFKNRIDRTIYDYIHIKIWKSIHSRYSFRLLKRIHVNSMKDELPWGVETTISSSVNPDNTLKW